MTAWPNANERKAAVDAIRAETKRRISRIGRKPSETAPKREPAQRIQYGRRHVIHDQQAAWAALDRWAHRYFPKEYDAQRAVATFEGLRNQGQRLNDREGIYYNATLRMRVIARAFRTNKTDTMLGVDDDGTIYGYRPAPVTKGKR